MVLKTVELPMSARIHIVVDAAEKERFRRAAERKEKTLSEWLREAARERLARDRERVRLDTLEELRAFFLHSDQRASGREPDWEKHERVIAASIRGGATSS